MDSDYENCYFYGLYRFILYIVVICIAFPVLVYKWTREKPRRSIRTWWFDVSKTLLGYLVLNTIPAYYFMASTAIYADIYQQYCRISFMGTLMDGILVTGFSYFFLMVFQNFSHASKKYRFYSGSYPKGCKSWIYQLILWLVIILISKLVVLTLVYIFYTPLYFLTFFVLYFLQWNSMLLKSTVLIVAPIVQNVFVFYINDEFLRCQLYKESNDNEPDNLLQLLNEREMMQRKLFEINIDAENTPNARGGYAPPNFECSPKSVSSTSSDDFHIKPRISKSPSKPKLNKLNKIPSKVKREMYKRRKYSNRKGSYQTSNSSSSKLIPGSALNVIIESDIASEDEPILDTKAKSAFVPERVTDEKEVKIELESVASSIDEPVVLKHQTTPVITDPKFHFQKPRSRYYAIQKMDENAKAYQKKYKMVKKKY
ncbi:unnamed protein product [Moneuplotes crassus]|uniref:Uncharacterized protein n=1 Tax=Euplotes crassus TaxID=5936 RepID=A0AAD1UIU6_EUPCR|nr:unnamed protein product [Moneuplotes crassus]